MFSEVIQLLKYKDGLKTVHYEQKNYFHQGMKEYTELTTPR